MSDFKQAFLFPGQGSQCIGMLSEFRNEKIVNDTFLESSEILGLDLWEIAQNGSVDKINNTIITQPLLLTSSIALWRLWLSWGRNIPSVMAGHSLGEYSALVCSEVIAFSSGIKLVSKRAELMQNCVPLGKGAMAAIIGLDSNILTDICTEVSMNTGTVSVANFNSIGQEVIAGNKLAVEKAIIKAKSSGAKLCKILPVSIPSHCELMLPASKVLAEYFDNFKWQEPKIDVINNVDVSCEKSVDAIKDALIRQLYMPVRWVETIFRIKQDGIFDMVECGTGSVLKGLNKRIDSNIVTTFIDTNDKDKGS